MTFKRTPKANLNNLFPLGGTGYVKETLSSERKVSVTSTPGIITGEPAPSLAMDATIDGHQYKGVLYLVSDAQAQEG